MTGSERPTASPRTITALLAVIFVAQGLFAAVAILGASGPGDASSLVVGSALVAYALMIGFLALGLVRRSRWAWPLALATAGAGLILAAARLAAGAAVDDHLFGMAIDAGLLYYLTTPGMRAILRP